MKTSFKKGIDTDTFQGHSHGSSTSYKIKVNGVNLPKF